MTVIDRLAFAPLVPGVALALIAALAALGFAIYLVRRGRAPISRALGLALLLIGLAQPVLVREAREPARDIAVVLVDQSESLDLAGRAEAARAAGDAAQRALAADPNLDVRVREVRGGPDGTGMVAALEEALGDAPRDRIAGAILVTDGQINDAPEEPSALRPLGPVHALIVGDPNRGDRWIELISAPAFGLVDEPLTVEAVVHDSEAEGAVRVRALIDGIEVDAAAVRANEPFRLTLRTPKRGPNLVALEVDPGREEITLSNNRAAFRLAGVRDRLRVLLVTGEPYPGARVWRNLLKSDPSVDLVHFTILRPPEKLDDTPLNELSLIQFPTYELFVEKLGQFDLLIFDRYRQRGILPPAYFENVVRRVEDGGALLIVAGPSDAGDDSVFRTSLAAILPSRPTGEVLETPFRPAATALGSRHPVVRGLPGDGAWGRWERSLSATASGGQTVLSGARGEPLLVLGRVGRGRVAQLWSDQVWLWARGYDGGGPHGELLRRLAHWLMQEPELDEERLRLEGGAGLLTIERATIAGGDPGPAILIDPAGAQTEARLSEVAPGLWRGEARAEAQGVWEARSGDLRAFAAVGPLNPKEAAALAATDAALRPIAQATGGGLAFIGEAGEAMPEIRRVGRRERAAGDGWIALRRREAYVVRATEAEPLGPGWAWAAAGLALLMLGWRREA